MEIYMDHVPYKASKYQVTAALAHIFHDPTLKFSQSHKADLGRPERNINFHVVLVDGHSGVQNNGTGYLTVPERFIGEKFLRMVSQREISVKVLDRSIRFRVSKRRARPDLVQTVKQVPYQDPSIDEERDYKLLRLDRQFRVDKLQFGVWKERPTKDRRKRGVFCTEWEKSYTSIGNALISIEYDHKLVRVQLGNAALDEHAHSVVLKYSNFRALWKGYEYGQAFLCFDLLSPPVFEHEWFNRELTGEVREDSRKFRERIGYIDDAHRVVAPFAFHLRLTLYQTQDLDEFTDLCREADIALPVEVDIDEEKHGLFSSKQMIQVEKRLQKLDWQVRYQVMALLHNGYVHPDELLRETLKAIEELSNDFPHRVADILKQLNERLKTKWPSPKRVLLHLQEICGIKLHDSSVPPSSDGLLNCHHVTFTPTRMTLEGPYVSQSNRILRKYVSFAQNFLRVDFRDEDRLQYRWDREVDGTSFLQGRVGGILKEGFDLGGRHFDFLGYSSSSLREHAVWFMAPFTHPNLGLITPAKIRKDIGASSDQELLITPAKYAARLAQAYTATDSSVTIGLDDCEDVEDLGKEPYLHSDGVGTISKELSDKIWAKLCESRHGATDSIVQPSAFQIRFLGYKGVVSVDESLPGIKMRLRKSMRKFRVQGITEAEIEIAGTFDRPGKMYLNRAFTMILEDRGVDANSFLKLQRDAVAVARGARHSLDQLITLFKTHQLGDSYRLSWLLGVLSQHSALGFNRNVPLLALEDPFMDRIVHCSINTVLHDIKFRARIPVPESWTLVGIVDEGAAYQKGDNDVFCLGPGEIYICVQTDKQSEPRYLKGNCCISRSPTVHPGDVQRVWAIGEPPQDKKCLFRNLKNVVVFPGQPEDERSLASKLGGGDLDGDLYNICFLPELLPVEHEAAAAYEPVDTYKIPEEELEELRDPNTGLISEEAVMPYVCEFVVEYMNSDVLGLLSDNHLIRADQSSDGTFDKGCMELAQLCSQAVDYPKNGVPVDITSIPRRLIPYKPDWKKGEEQNARRTDFYESSRAVGQLYRDLYINPLVVDNVNKVERKFKPSQTSPIFQALKPLVTKRLPKRPQRQKERTEQVATNQRRVENLFQHYVDELNYICVTHTLSSFPDERLSEQEVVVGTIDAECSQSRWRKERIHRAKVHTVNLIADIQRQLESPADDDAGIRKNLDLAWQAYQFAVDKRTEYQFTAKDDPSSPDPGFGFYSFGLIALRVTMEALVKPEALGEIANDKPLGR